MTDARDGPPEKPPPQKFVLTFVVEKWDRRPSSRRVRALLKYALRACSLRCVRIETK